MLKIWEFDALVTGIENFVDNDKIIARIVQLERKQDFDFKTGQFVMITVPGYEPGENLNKQLWRAYSVCSSPTQADSLELCIAIKAPPSFTSFMDKNINIGSTVRVKGPYGAFTLKNDYDEIIFIAAGTGIAPIISMIRTLYLTNEKRPMKLFYGYRNSNQFYYGDELQTFAEIMENFQLFTIASREGENPGHVQKLIEKFEFDENKGNADIFICGPPKMVEDAKAIMKQKGFSRIYVEEYD